MLLKVFSVYDSKVMAHLQPFFSESVGGAVRAFSDASNDKDCPFTKHPGDYQLYEIGLFDNNSGLLTPCVPMKLLGCAADFVLQRVPPVSSDMLRVPEVVANGS